MLHTTSVFESFRRKSPDPLRETPVHVRGLSIGRFYLPPGHNLQFPPRDGVQRLHLVLGGRALAEWGGASLLVGAHKVFGLSPAQELKLVSAEGLILISIVFRTEDAESVPTSPGFTLFDLDTPNQASLFTEISRWAQVPPVGARLGLQTLGPLSSGVDEESPRHLLFLGNGAHFHAQEQDIFPAAGDVISVPAGLPYTLHPLHQGLVLVLREHGSLTDLYLPPCGRRAATCHVANVLGYDGLVLDVMGGVVSRIRGAATSPQGWWPQEGSNVLDELDPPSAAWLKVGLSRVDVVASRGELTLVEGARTLSVVLQPYRGSGEDRTFLLHVTPVERGAPLPSPDKGPPLLPRVWASTIQKFAGERQWLIIWGATPGDRETFAQALHHASPWVSRPCLPLDASTETPASLEVLLRRGRPELPDMCLPRQQGATFMVSGLSSWPAFRRVDLLQRLGRLSLEPYSASCRVILLLEKRPGRGLEGGEAHDGHLERGPFVVVRLPSLGEMGGELPQIMSRALGERSPSRVFSREGLDWIKQHPFGGGLSEFTTLIEWAREQELPLSVEQLDQFTPAPPQDEDDIPTLDEALRHLLTRALSATGGNRAKVARLLGITRPRLYRLMAEYRLEGEGNQ